MAHWTMKVINWWNHNCDSVLVWMCIFTAGLIVGSCVGFAQ